MRRIASIVYLLTGIVIGLGAFGHGSNVHHLAAGFAQAPGFDPGMMLVVYAVWYFVSGCMLVFGAVVVWTWLRARRGERAAFFPSDAIGVLYAITGPATVLYTGKPFFWLFFALGVLLLTSAFVLRRPA